VSGQLRVLLLVEVHVGFLNYRPSGADLVYPDDFVNHQLHLQEQFVVDAQEPPHHQRVETVSLVAHQHQTLP
jgi:hypothetical protein